MLDLGDVQGDYWPVSYTSYPPPVVNAQLLPDLAFMPALHALIINRNRMLYGGIPYEWFDKSRPLANNLQRLLLDRNNLGGPLPAGMNNITTLTELILYGNLGMCGPMPSGPAALCLDAVSTHLGINCTDYSITLPPPAQCMPQNGTHTPGQNFSVTPILPFINAMLQLKAANGKTQYNWQNNTNPCGPIWTNVMCNVDGQVEGLALRGQNLTGTLPAGLSILPSLTALDFGQNSFTGKEA